MMLEYLWWATPQFLYYIIAIAVLLAALVTIGLLTKNSELIVMRACGISLYRTAVPLLVFALAASAVLFAFEERVLAPSNRRAGQLNHIIRGGAPQTFDVLNRKWLAGTRRRDLSLPVLQSAQQELNGLSVFRFDAAARDARASARMPRAPATRRAGRMTAPRGRSAAAGCASSPAGEVTRYEPFDTARAPLEPPDYFVHRGAGARAHELHAAARLHRAARGERLQRPRARGGAATASSPSRS